MAKRAQKNDFMDDLFSADTSSRKVRRRCVAPPPAAGVAGPSGPAMAGGPSGPAMAGGPSGPAMAGGPSGPAFSGGPSGPAMSGGAGALGKGKPAKKRRRLDKNTLDQLYG